MLLDIFSRKYTKDVPLFFRFALFCNKIGKGNGPHVVPLMANVLRKAENTNGVLLTCPTSAAYWLIIGSAMCYHALIIKHAQDP